MGLFSSKQATLFRSKKLRVRGGVEGGKQDKLDIGVGLLLAKLTSHLPWPSLIFMPKLVEGLYQQVQCSMFSVSIIL